MNWKSLAVALVAVFLSASASVAQLAPAQEAARAALEANPDLEYSPTTVLVRFDDRFTAHDRAAARAVISGGLLHEYPVAGLEHIEVGIPVDQALAILRHLPFVVYAEPDYIVQATTTPNDPLFGSLWGMQNIRAPEAWDVATGDGQVIVAVIDSGVQYTHEDLNDNMWPGLGFDFYDGNADPWDEYGHGTHVAGTIGAAGNNETGVVGVNCPDHGLAFSRA